jgi:hypothetical protein
MLGPDVIREEEQCRTTAVARFRSDRIHLDLERPCDDDVLAQRGQVTVD